MAGDELPAALTVDLDLLYLDLSVDTILIFQRPRGLMDKASDFESEDCEFESRRGRFLQWF